ncbi:MAG: IclR family transcriptional regulator domain-containing protein [Chloroflexota bacterium]
MSIIAVRRDGYAQDEEEYVTGLRCVAAPIRGDAASVIAAMSVSIPATRASRPKLELARDRLTEAATELSRCLGYRPEVHLAHAGHGPSSAGANDTGS